MWPEILSTLYILQTSYFAKSFCGTRFGTGNWEWGRLSFRKSGCRRIKQWAGPVLDCRRNPLRNLWSLKLDVGAVDWAFEGWLSKEARNRRQQGTGSWNTAGTRSLEKAGEKVGSKRGKEWEKGVFGIRSLQGNVGMKAQSRDRCVRSGNRTSIRAEEIWLQRNRAWRLRVCDH